MKVFAINDLFAARSKSSKPYFEFLRVPALSAGVYVLPAGVEDKQQPHSEDEMYYVVRGSGRFRTEEDGVSQDVPVSAGSVIFDPPFVRLEDAGGKAARNIGADGGTLH